MSVSDFQISTENKKKLFSAILVEMTDVSPFCDNMEENLVIRTTRQRSRDFPQEKVRFLKTRASDLNFCRLIFFIFK